MKRQLRNNKPLELVYEFIQRMVSESRRRYSSASRIQHSTYVARLVLIYTLSQYRVPFCDTLKSKNWKHSINLRRALWLWIILYRDLRTDLGGSVLSAADVYYSFCFFARQPTAMLDANQPPYIWECTVRCPAR